jgi:hypothetical protein
MADGKPETIPTSGATVGSLGLKHGDMLNVRMGDDGAAQPRQAHQAPAIHRDVDLDNAIIHHKRMRAENTPIFFSSLTMA